MSFKALVAAILSLATGAAAAAAADYTVSPGGDDAAPGTAAAPWRTLTHAAGQVMSGDNVFIEDGLYDSLSGEDLTIHLIAGTNWTGLGSGAVLDFDQVTVEGGLSGVTLQADVSVEGLDAIISSSVLDGVIQVWASARDPGEGISKGLVVYRSIVLGRIDVDASELTPDGSGHVSAGVYVANCLFDHSEGISARSSYHHGRAMAAVNVQHCTFVGGALTAGPGSSPNEGESTVAVANSIFYEYDGTGAIQPAGTETELLLTGDIFYSSGADPPLPGHDCESFLGLFPEERCVDPQLVDPDGGDYHLSLWSPAVNTGFDMGHIVDLDGNSRPYGPAPDVGCYELMEAATLDVLRADCTSIDPLDPTREDIFPLEPPGTPVILAGLGFPGEAVDPEGSILGDDGRPLMLYGLWPAEAGNRLRAVKDLDTDSVRLVFGY